MLMEQLNISQGYDKKYCLEIAPVHTHTHVNHLLFNYLHPSEV